jgi:uncharacterized SAM-binding protein YcdF (DUF218 family)
MRTRLRKALIRLGILLNVLAMLYVLRFPILRGIGNFLIVEDGIAPCDALYVLSGNPTDRGREGAALLNAGVAPVAVCTGGDHSAILKTFGIDTLHCHITRKVMLEHGADSARIRVLPEGTSTMEEYEAIRDDAKAHGYGHVMIVTSRFHTRRTSQVFRGRLRREGIEASIHGADDMGMDEEHWWKHEEALLFVNQEYIKMFYYWIKY